MKPDKHHACRRTPACINQLTKIVVLCDEYALPFQSSFQHLVVGSTLRDFCNGNHVVTGFTQRLITGIAQLSSATKFMAYDLLASGSFGSRITSSCATLAAP